MDELARRGVLPERVAAIEASFPKFLFVGSRAALRWSVKGDAVVAAVESNGLTTASISLHAVDRARMPSLSQLPTDAAPAGVPGTPIGLRLEDVPGRSGSVAAAAASAVPALFPHAAAALGAERVTTIALLSTVVGMVCPGLHSLFGGFRLATVPAQGAEGLRYAVGRVDERVRLVELAVARGDLGGTITAFVRPEPVAVSADAVRAAVRSGEFDGRSALVIGGSRGLGAATARILVEGGAQVTITYATLADEAASLAAELGDRCRTLRYDAAAPAAPQLDELPWVPEELYYFASPQIFRQKSSLFAAELFAEFCAVYVAGFDAACRGLLALDGATSLRAYYPSSTAVAERPRDMTEYAMAKAAAEVLCADLERFDRRVNVLMTRLPRVRTDQTATLLPIDAADPVDIMVPIVRRLGTMER